jgi:hypothetical protein
MCTGIGKLFEDSLRYSARRAGRLADLVHDSLQGGFELAGLRIKFGQSREDSRLEFGPCAIGLLVARTLPWQQIAGSEEHGGQVARSQFVGATGR